MKVKQLLVSLLCLFVILSLDLSTVKAAAAVLNLDGSWEDLYIETGDLEGIFDQPYAKFTSKVNTDDYYINVSSDPAIRDFIKACDNAKISYSPDRITGFKVTAYQYGDEDDKVITKASELYLPIPDDAQEYPEGCRLYKVSGGKPSLVNATIYTDDFDANYVLLKFNSAADYSTVYGFIYDEVPEEVEEEEEEEEEEEIEAKPTAAPTPTSKPSSKPDDSSKTDSEVKPTSKPASDVTKAPSSTNKDTVKVPKTGDDFPMGLYTILAIGAGGALVTALYLSKKK